jgi:hypothetical protein
METGQRQQHFKARIALKIHVPFKMKREFSAAASPGRIMSLNRPG